MPNPVGEFLTGIGQGIVQPIVEQQQQQKLQELALQNYIRQQTVQQQMQKQQEQLFAEQLSPALTNYANMLTQAGRQEEAQNVIAGLEALRAGGIQGLQVQQQFKPKEKQTKQKTFGADREALSHEFYGVDFGDLEKGEQAKVNQELQTIKKEQRFPELGLRVLDAYDREPNVRSFRELKDSVNQMSEVLKGGIERGDYSFADQAAIVMFNKVIDPTSVVREGEFSRTTTFIKWTERLKAMVEKIQAGGNLTDKERQELINTSYDMLKSAHKVTSGRTKTFIERGKRFGLTSEDFDPVGEISVPEKPILPTIKELTPEQVRKQKHAK